jgi:hypothetical protein
VIESVMNHIDGRVYRLKPTKKIILIYLVYLYNNIQTYKNIQFFLKIDYLLIKNKFTISHQIIMSYYDIPFEIVLILAQKS